MHISLMLIILSAVLFIALFFMCFFREKLSHPLINPLFIFVCAVFFFCWNYATFERRGGDFHLITLENISPYISTVIILTPLMTRWLKEYAYATIAFLGFGVFLNLVFYQTNFGMNMHGKYSIYFLDIFGSFEVTLIAYLVGIFAVMAGGYLAGALLDKISRHHKKEYDQHL